MLFKILLILVLFGIYQPTFAQWDNSNSNPAGFDDQSVPDFWDGINNQHIHTEAEKALHYPIFLDERNISVGTKIYSYTLNQFLWEFPHDENLEFKGPIQCKHIALIHAASNKPILWEENNPKASNIFYHVHRSIEYYEQLQEKLNPLSSKLVQFPIRQIPIRVDMKVDYAMWIQFSKIPMQNTSKTVPDPDPDLWNTVDEKPEIWFYTPKRARFPSWIPTTWIPGLRDTYFGTAGFPLDTAMNPSIVSHEWSHLMTKPFLGIQQNTVLNETYSNYFGSVIQGSEKMAGTPEYSTDPYALNFFVPDDVELPRLSKSESKNPANEAIPKLFWRLKKRYGNSADQMIWNALSYLNPKSDISSLSGALKQSCPKVFSREKCGEIMEIVAGVL